MTYHEILEKTITIDILQAILECVPGHARIGLDDVWGLALYVEKGYRSDCWVVWGYIDCREGIWHCINVDNEGEC